jgi:hypothetical protein
VPSPSFSSCWKLLGFRLESIFRCIVSPSPRLRTDIDDSVRKGTAKVPAMAGLRLPGGGRSLYFQSSAPAVVIWLAICRSGGGEIERSRAGAEDAVVKVGV